MNPKPYPKNAPVQDKANCRKFLAGNRVCFFKAFWKNEPRSACELGGRDRRTAPESRGASDSPASG